MDHLFYLFFFQGKCINGHLNALNSLIFHCVKKAHIEWLYFGCSNNHLYKIDHLNVCNDHTAHLYFNANFSTTCWFASQVLPQPS